MQKINFSTSINASKEKVWEILWNPDSYKAWTSAFTEGSYAKTDNWKEGTKVLFLNPEGSGMVSMVAVNKPNEYMSFKHLGEVKEGVEDTSSDSVKVWAGSTENYTLKDENGTSILSVDMDITEEFKKMFEKIWPIALEKVKALAEGTAKTLITIEAEVNAPVEKVWYSWTLPEHITQWCHASDDWHCPKAENDIRPGGKFSSTMAAKDGSFSFDFGGIHDEVVKHRTIASTMGDGRKMQVNFEEKEGKTMVRESFEAESMNSLELQRGGWQAILNNFKKHTEAWVCNSP
ncbi:MAG: SRPBCC domain-containing protein [Chitinophagaceae bacterium]